MREGFLVDTWDEVFREMRSELARRSAPGLVRAGQILDRLGAEPADAGLLSDLRRELQDLAGDSGRYGSPALATLAQEGERTCDALLAAAEHPSAAHLDRWRALLAAIAAGLAG